ncbi:5'-nucleotidase C-terminal domain-containing protein [Knoellia sp. 3-2P3]|uniref:bifunctional metallophosphatase/5'-nucleotidase n=1 Tax=unclassified Knoellia TaxID=2618719 RepID=UPI0023DCA9F3|nr:5'-nucleotidase C-terminal domain-containing protein [Knoellia sp. 3-2P3]MDF2092957.1 5'-nucleotidase C-terminal domain-containing protein [Knoellia sp. 3-2P3]
MSPKSPTAIASLASLERSRREMLGLAVVGGASAAFFAAPGRAEAAQDRGSHVDPRRYRLTVMGTTDTHGNVFNWDYFKDAEYTDRDSNDIGLAKVATLVKAVRAERGAESCLLLDAGDTIQGTPLSYYYAKVDPITGGSKHPMATAMNTMGYDAAALGNHEYNYGLETLRVFEEQCDFPLLSANSLDWNTGAPVFPPYLIRTIKVPGQSRPLKVGILGLVTPGVAIWDKANVEGRVRFDGIVEQGKVWVPRLKEAGCDVVIVSCHSGSTPGSSYGDALPFPENASTQLAEEVPGIDAVLVGHAHVEIPQRFVENRRTGAQVLLTEPHKWGMRLAVMDFDLVRDRDGWKVAEKGATLLNANTVDEDEEVAAVLQQDHDIVVTYVNSVIGTSTAAMSAQTARFEDTAALDFINHVQGLVVREALAGTPEASLPVLSIAAPFNRDAAIPAGDVTVRDVAGLYIYDNTLLGIKFTGQQVKDYLEYSAGYFQQVDGTKASYAPDEVTNAKTAMAPGGTPDYNYDVMAGLDASLSYDIDIAQAPGSRITNLQYAGEPIDLTGEFIIAINNYRQSGGGNFPGVKAAPVVYNAQLEIRQAIIDWVTAQGTIDPPSFTVYDWRLVAGGTPIKVEGASEGGRH